jgi:hypothetical protein
MRGVAQRAHARTPPSFARRATGFLPGGVSKYTFRLDAALGELRSMRVRLRPQEGHAKAGWFLQEVRTCVAQPLRS